MNLEDFEKLAKDAIAKYEESPFKLTDKPMANIGRKSRLPADFPIPHEYLGRNRWGFHVYLLDAQGILQYTERYRQEFEI